MSKAYIKRIHTYTLTAFMSTYTHIYIYISGVAKLLLARYMRLFGV